MASSLLRGKLALVTGAGSGIGRAACVRFAQEGATVVCGDRSKQKAEDTSKILGVDHFAVGLDVTDSKSVQNVLDEIVSKYRRTPNTLVNCAGITRDNFMLKMDEDEFDLVLKVNFKGTWLMTKYAVQKMVESKINGSVVNISSVTSKMGNIGQSNYAPSKAAVESMTRVAAKEFARYGVRVNCVVPGFIMTPMTDTVPEKVKDIVVKQIAMRRFGEANEISDAIAFLASDKAAYVTGTSLEVTGGMF